MEQSGLFNGNKPFTYTVSDKNRGMRLDHYLVLAAADTSRSQIIVSIKSGEVQVNGSTVKAGYRLKAGDRISGFIKDLPQEASPRPQPVDFDVLYEDDSLLLIAKPPGVVVHPGSGNRDNTLVNGLVYKYKDISGVGDESRPGIVHRLDKDTSGIMLIARTRAIHRKLVQEFKDRNIEKHYLSLVHGNPEGRSGRVVAAIGRHRVNRQKMAVNETGGRYAASNWIIRETFRGYSLLEVHIETGRTHQIRVHMAHVGFPVAGDRVYGPNRVNDLFPRQLLHAWKLRFRHPDSGEEMTVEAPLPVDFSTILNSLRELAC